MTLRLVGDVGGTNCRFALVDPSDPDAEVVDPEAFKVADHATLEDAIDHYLEGADGRPTEAVIAVAGPVIDGKAELTNARWDMSEASLIDHGFAAARLLNDYEALVLSVKRLRAKDLADIGDVRATHPKGTVAIVGAGTGLGVGALVRDARGDAAAVTEGGHIAFAPTDGTEIEVLKILTARFGRVSLERILSGPGLVNLYGALAQIGGQTAEDLKPEDIEARAEQGDALATQTLKRFCRIYGAAAGDFALAFGALGGVYLGGGIAGKILDQLRAGDFREGFEDKGRFRDYCAAIPTKAILHPYAALLGAAAADVAH
ncbi:MAG: glucokinase [Caulobacteraceae bacterium]|nr:MAG: glucokinase [Caulobacteraceae bacterium]